MKISNTRFKRSTSGTVPAEQHDSIVRSYLSACGMSAASSNHAPQSQERFPLRTPMQASADPNCARLMRRVIASARRCGYSLDVTSNKPIDLGELDRAIRNADISERFELKSMLAEIGCLR
jgi:hypothetical protein